MMKIQNFAKISVTRSQKINLVLGPDNNVVQSVKYALIRIKFVMACKIVLELMIAMKECLSVIKKSVTSMIIFGVKIV